MRSLISFYKEKETVPVELKANALQVARCEFHSKSIMTRAFSSLLIGFILSLIVCPQFGFGIPSGHGVSHFFWMIGPWACALFCGFFLYLCGGICLGLALNKFERFWFMQKTKSMNLLITPMLWGFFMLMPNTNYVSVSYSLSWAVGFVGMWLLSRTIFKKMVMVNP